MSLLLNTGAMHYRENVNDDWKPLVIKANADLTVLADEYSNASTYVVGEYCRYDGKLYRCTTAIATAESWTPAHWTETNIGDELESIKDDVSIKETELKHRRFLYIGDSYNGVTSTKWTDIVDSMLGLSNSVVVAQGGYGFVTSNNKTWLSLLQNATISDEDTITDILICGGANDTWGTQSNIPIAMHDFNTYVKQRFSGLKNVWLGFAGNTYYGGTQRTNMRSAMRYYISGAGGLGWRYLSGIETTLLYPAWMQKIGTEDYIHPNETGVIILGRNIAQCVLMGSCNNYHGTELISFSTNTSILNEKTFTISEALNNNVVSITMGDITFTAKSALSGAITIATCPELQNMVNAYTFMTVFCTSGGNSFIGILYFSNYTTLGLIIPGGTTIASGASFMIHGFSMTFDILL